VRRALTAAAPVLALGLAVASGQAQTPAAGPPAAGAAAAAPTPRAPAAPTAPTVPPTAPAPPEGAAPPPAATPPPADGAETEPPPSSPIEIIQKQAKEARALIKEKRFAEGLAKLRDAVAQADAAALSTADKAELLDDYAWALRKAGQDSEALAQQNLAVQLQPADPFLLINRGWMHFRLEHYDQAIADAQQALRLHPSADEAEDARDLLKEARTERLQERLEFVGGVAISFDSNILQNQQYQTIANQSTVSARKTQTRPGRTGSSQSLGQQLVQAIDDFANPNRPDLYVNHVLDDYRTAAPSLTQWGLPLNVNLDLIGRLGGSPRAGLWLGYRFEQTFMLAAETDPTGMLPAADGYNFQQHIVTLRVSGQPRPWLDFNIRAEGFVNFSGLEQFTPFQGGINGVLDLVFIESKQWRTRFTVSNRYRKSFDQEDDGYLDGNRDMITLSQELRRTLFRLKLGYQFTYDNTGVLTASSAVYFPLGMTAPQVGTYNYNAPLSYQGHQVFLTGRLNLPHHLFIRPGLHYEYDLYADQYYATFIL
jgi:tetratricopeptide (TPR) repeat protein